MAVNPNAGAGLPNVVFVFPDQLGATWLGCYGNPDVISPNIDRFAAEGLTFDRAYTASPICTPFRGTLFTGRYPCQTGIDDNGRHIPRSEVTLPALLNQGGYATAYVGKWHLSGPQGGNRWVPPVDRAGFQRFVGWDCGHVDHWKGRIWENDPDKPIVMRGHETDALTEIACEQLRRLAKIRFCLFVAYQAPHAPASPPRELAQVYGARDLSYRPNVADIGVADDKDPRWYTPDVPTFLRNYYGEITQLDAAFGRLLSAIDELGLEKNTIVIYTSDHGEMAGCHGRYGKFVMYEESTRIPLFVRHPRGPKGVRTDALFSSADFMPTLLDLCGRPPAPTAEGISYGPLVRGEQQDLREAAFSQYKDLCIWQGSYKLVTDYAAAHPIALYDLAADPFEQNNLVTDARFAEIGDRLHAELRAWLEDALARVGDTEEAHRQRRERFWCRDERI